MWGMVARNWLPMEHKLGWEIPLELRAPLYAKFDSGWYLSIMEWGYGPPPPVGRPSSHAFFPLYPFTAKVFRDTFAMDGFHAGLLVSYVCLFLAVSLFLREGIERLGEKNGWRAVFFLLLFPTAFFLAALEAPRPAGARRYLRAALLGAVPVAVVLLWVYGMGWAKHEPGLFFRSMEGWHRGSSTIAGVEDFFRGFYDHLRLGDLKRDFSLFLDYLMVLTFAAIGVYQLVRRL